MNVATNGKEFVSATNRRFKNQEAKPDGENGRPSSKKEATGTSSSINKERIHKRARHHKNCEEDETKAKNALSFLESLKQRKNDKRNRRLKRESLEEKKVTKRIAMNSLTQNTHRDRKDD